MHGFIAIIFGGMFSGKTKELEKRIERIRIAIEKQKALTVRPKPEAPILCLKVFKPIRDTRTERCGNFDAVKVSRPADILPLAEGCTDLFIDEAHFWNSPEEAEELRHVVLTLARRGIRVTVSLLNADFRGRPFLTSGLMLGIATEVELCNAVCGVCGADASFSQRIVGGTETLQVGSSEYEPRCVCCYEEPPLSP